jgi:hypothetical protein
MYRNPSQYSGTAMAIAMQLVREMDPASPNRFGQAAVVALEFYRSYPSDSPEQKFWAEVRSDIIDELMADAAAPESEQVWGDWLEDPSRPWPEYVD